jgi:hypothetical protein
MSRRLCLPLLVLIAVLLPACRESAVAPGEAREPTGPDLCAVGSGATTRPGTPIALAVGQFRMLSADEGACFRLPGGLGEYAFTWLDVGDIERQRTRWDPSPLPSGEVVVKERTTPRPQVRDGVGVAAASVGQAGITASGIVGAAQTAPCRDDSFPQGQFWCRSRPWTLGESFTVRSSVSSTGLATATVTWLSDDAKFVVAEVPGGDATDEAVFRESLRHALPVVMQHAMPLYRRIFGRDPLTSAGSGQLLLLYGPYAHGQVSGGCCFGEVGLTNVIVLGVGLRRRPADMVQLLAHEYAHVWANRWFYETRPSGGAWGGGDVWANEGLADLLSFEVLRRVAGMPFEANATAAQFDAGGGPAKAWELEFSPTGDFLAGYAESSGFLRDLVRRLVRRGMSIDDALALVARHTSEGWYGFDPSQQQRTGLVRAMETALGVAWDPTVAMRMFMLAQAADDLTPNTDLQNVFRRNVSAYVGGDLRIGVREGRPRFATSVPFGGVGAIRLLDRPGGATFEARSVGNRLVWGIARVR